MWLGKGESDKADAWLYAIDLGLADLRVCLDELRAMEDAGSPGLLPPGCLSEYIIEMERVIAASIAAQASLSQKNGRRNRSLPPDASYPMGW